MIMSTKGVIAVNGSVTAPEEAKVSALDRGFLFGDNVFETFVGFQDKLLDASQHLARLRYSAGEIGLGIPWSDEELTFELTSLIEQVAVDKKSVRLVVTRGEGLGLRVKADFKPTRVVYAFPAPVESPTLYQEGICLKRQVCATRRGAAPKTGNYLASIIAMQRAEREGFQDILWSNDDGEVTESSTSNIFFMAREGDNVHFVTPPTTSGILLGITRTTLIKLLQQARIPVVRLLDGARARTGRAHR
jgi:branched-chain amino acid aminotransferase